MFDYYMDAPIRGAIIQDKQSFLFRKETFTGDSTFVALLENYSGRDNQNTERDTLKACLEQCAKNYSTVL